MDKIKLTFDANEVVKSAVESNANYIKSEVLAFYIQLGSPIENV